jgi:hypothetical protein
MRKEKLCGSPCVLCVLCGKKHPQRTQRRKGAVDSPKPAKRLEESFYPSEKLTKCSGKTGQTSGRID